MFSRLVVAGIPIKDLLRKKVLIAGAGGLGVLVAEMLARSGVGSIYIIDRDNVREENFNRLGFTRDDVGRPKAIALATKLVNLRNSVEVPQEYHIHVRGFHTDLIGWPQLENLVADSDIIFSCLDNEEARRELNYLIMKYKKPFIDGATSIDSLSGTIITVIPCKTPCYECYYGSGTSIRLNNVERIGYCDASLATTMAIIAALQVDQGLKILLNFGKIYPLIKVYLKKEISISPIENVKIREDCPVHRRFCK